MAPLGPVGLPGSRRALVHHIIFEHDSGWAKWFDVGLLLAILASVSVVMIDSVADFNDNYGPLLGLIEWVFTLIFTIEYVLRLWAVRRPRAYAFSFFGIIDLLSVIPAYISLFLPGSQFLAVIRVLRILRIFRILKLTRYVGEAGVLGAALRASRYKVSVFLVSVLSIVVVVGSVMYIIEGPVAGFTSIPVSVYWAIVTLTTVGYGDVVPLTPIGQALASIIMIMGYGIIAVPTGIVTAELTSQVSMSGNTSRTCKGCMHKEDDPEALYCPRCGEPLA